MNDREEKSKIVHDQDYYAKILYERMEAIEKKIHNFEKTTGIPLTMVAQDELLMENFVNASAMLGTGKDPISKILSKILLKMAEFVKMTGKNEAYFRFLFSTPKQHRESLVPVKETKIQEVKEIVEEYTGRSFTKEAPLSYANKLSNACVNVFVSNTGDLLKLSNGQIGENISLSDTNSLKKNLQNMLVNTFVKSYNDTMKDLQLHPDKALSFFKTIDKNIEKMGHGR